METINHKVSRNVPTSADWSYLRPIVTELYQRRRWTMTQVSDHLNSIGYRVNTRMVRGRITQWKIQRNHRLQDMVAALRLLDPDPAKWSSPDPKFLIRGHTVTMKEVLHFFRRKEIPDPLHWVQSIAVDQGKSDVKVLEAEAASEAVTVEPQSTSPVSGPPLLTQSNKLPMQILTLEQKAVANLHNYCSAYIGLGHAAARQEPPTHQFTPYGKFGYCMQEGLAQMVRGGPDAIRTFDRGFEQIRALLSDCHPMSLAQFLTVICELDAQGARAILYRLLRYSAAMASILQVSNFVTDFLTALWSLSYISQVVITSLRAALGAYREQQPNQWQRLYIQERLCDCLYHGKERSEGSVYRASLLRDQEALYDPFKGKVLWTLTNIADDQLYSGNVEGAELYYTTTLSRAAHLTGFGRAKYRFAALEGLARTEELRIEKMKKTPSQIDRGTIRTHLQEAYRYIDEALIEAVSTFEKPSRRIIRAQERRIHISNLLASLNHAHTPETCLGDSNPNPWHDSSKEYLDQDGL